MKNYADLGGCYPPQPSASDNTLLDLHHSSYHTQPHPIIAKYLRIFCAFSGPNMVIINGVIVYLIIMIYSFILF